MSKIYELKKEIYNSFKEYNLKVLDSNSKLFYGTFKEKNLERILEQLINKKFLLNEKEDDIITTISAPKVSRGYQINPLTPEELLDFYKKFQAKSNEYTNKKITKHSEIAN
ncbi:hypothetical protein J4437_06565 [Candidatus Woesearchaeota archaeon]|nr:hypothetical protein [Candidatus Woesearchaeota archaeon]